VTQKCLPLLRWAGSKKRQFGSISKIFPNSYNSYAEPFAGSAAFAFCLGTNKAILNDINVDLTSFYHDVTNDPKGFYKKFSDIPRGEKSYYEIRSLFNNDKKRDDRSVLFYYLNRNCFNGIHRLNKRGEFNVPFSSSRVSSYLSEEQFLRSVEVVRSAKIYSLDFEEFCDNSLGRGDFVFIDPPYYSAERIFNEYNIKPFDREDFSRLEELLVRLNRKGVRFLLSFPEVPESLELASVWNSSCVPVRRTIASDPAKRRVSNELLIRNYAV